MPGRLAILAYGLLAYASFHAAFLYLVLFLADGPVPFTLETGPRLPVAAAVAVDAALVGLFALQHTLMARPAFKRVWTRFVPEPAERATYVMLSTLALLLLYAFWQPIGGSVWQVTSPVGWVLLLYATFLIDHFDLFGLRQAWLAFRGRPYTHHPFRTPGLYRRVRHPIYVAWFVIFWATPAMSVGHLLLALGTTAYIALAVLWEERDLVGHFGDTYRRYQETTPRFVPRPGRRVEADAEPAPVA